MSWLEMVGRTDTGRKREHNEDVIRWQFQPDRPSYALLADGMGGARAGDVASRLLVEALAQNWQELPMPEALIKRQIEQANRIIYRQAQDNLDWHGMGTTLVAAIMTPQDASIYYVGDSRAYLWRKGDMQQMSEDHSVVQSWVNQGVMSEEEARASSRRNLLTRAVGIKEQVEADYLTIDWREGDILLLCSDGLSDYVDEQVIRETIGQSENLKLVAARLVQLANEAGGLDNISVILCRHNGKQGDQDQQ